MCPPRPPVGTGHPSSQCLLPPHPIPPWMSLKGAAAVLGSLGPTCPFTSSYVPSAGFLPPPSERNPMYPQEHEDMQGFPGCCALGHRFLVCVTPMPSLCSCGALHRVHLLLPPWANVTQSTTGLSVDPHAPSAPTAPETAAAPVFSSTAQAQNRHWSDVCQWGHLSSLAPMAALARGSPPSSMKHGSLGRPPNDK